MADLDAVRRFRVGYLDLVLVVTVVIEAACTFAPSVSAEPLAGNWVPNGVALVSDPRANDISPALAADGTGGFFLVWIRDTSSYRTGQVRALHFLSSGQHDPAWPGGGLVVDPFGSSISCVSDGAGGFNLLWSSSTSGLTLTRITATGARAPGWGPQGVTLPRADATVLASEPDGTAWVVQTTYNSGCGVDGPCNPFSNISVMQLAPDGTFRPGLGPPGLVLYSAAPTYSVAARGWAGGVDVFSLGGNSPYVLTFARVLHDGSSDAQSIQGPEPFGGLQGSQFDLDPVGGVVVTNVFWQSPGPSLEKLTPVYQWGGGILFPESSPAYPSYYFGAFGTGALFDGSGGAYLSWVEEDPVGNKFPRLGHVLSNGAQDPTWPDTGAVLAPTAIPFVDDGIVRGSTSDALVFWGDGRHGETDLYLSRYQTDGTLFPGWPQNGVALRVNPAQLGALDVVRNGTTGLYAVWEDARNGTWDLYGQSILFDSPVATLIQSSTARLSGGRVELLWQFEQVAASGLEVERAASDGSWRPLGPVSNGGSPFEVRYEDALPTTGSRNTYRLRDPSTRWTGGQVSIEVPGPVVFGLVRLTPNPATLAAAVTLRLSSTAEVELQVSDSGGRRALSRSWSPARAGEQSLRWPELGSLEPGVYWLRARQGDGSACMRFVTLR